MQTKAGQTFRVKHESPLLKYLFELFPGQSRTGVKQMLSKGQILVNDNRVTAFDHPLFTGDTLQVLPKGISIARESAADAGEELAAALIRVVFEDEKIIVVDKPSGLPVTAPAGEKGPGLGANYVKALNAMGGKSSNLARKGGFTLYSMLYSYVRSVTRASRKEALLSGQEVDRATKKVWLVHRMERGASGLMIFAKDERTKDLLQSKWDALVAEHTFTVWLEGEVKPACGSIETWLREDEKAHKLVSLPEEAKESVRAVSHYKTKDYIRKDEDGKILFTVTAVSTLSRRPDLIRSQAEFIGHPVAGDGKYGAYWDPIERLAIHSSALVFRHPYTGGTIRCNSPLPEAFSKIR